MPERVVPGPVSGSRDNCEAVCIHTKKIFDSCREKDIAYYRILPIKINVTSGSSLDRSQRVLSFSLCGI